MSLRFEVKTYKRNDDELYRGLTIGWVTALVLLVMLVWVWAFFDIGMSASKGHWMEWVILTLGIAQAVMGSLFWAKLVYYMIKNRFTLLTPEENDLRMFLAKVRTKNTTEARIR